jgi:hypothetical protein
VTHRLALQIVLAMSVAAAACGNDAVTPTSPTSPAESVDSTSRLFAGTLAPRGTAFFSFTVAQDSGVFLTLASVTPTSGRGAVPTLLDLGLGVPRGTGCAVTRAITTSADLAAQIREWRTAGVHCVSVSDAGRLAADVAFAVRIGYYQ